MRQEIKEDLITDLVLEMELIQLEKPLDLVLFLIRIEKFSAQFECDDRFFEVYENEILTTSKALGNAYERLIGGSLLSRPELHRLAREITNKVLVKVLE